MAPLMYLSLKRALFVYLVLFLSAASILLSTAAVSSSSENELQSYKLFGSSRRMLLELEKDQDLQQNPHKKSSSKNQTKLIKAKNSSNKNQTNLTKTNNLSITTKNQTKLTTTKNHTKLTITTTTTTLSSTSSKMLNSTSLLKKLNSTSKDSKLSKSLDPIKLISHKNKTTKPTPPKSQTLVDKKLSDPKKTQKLKHAKPTWLDQGETEGDDLVSEFRDLPIKFQQTLLPDLERISTTSKSYINKYNKEITKGFKPIVGHKYAATIASIVSFAFILIPLILVTLIFNHFKAYFSLQKILIFIQVYLSIYFSILCLSSLVTGLEPLKFFYATSQSTYVCLQVMQTLGYVLYLLLLLMYLILVFSTKCGLGSKLLGLGQTFVGYAVGLHYYVAVFHRVVLHRPPKTNWKVHGMYATCFLVISLFARAERRKKAYLEGGGEEGKKN